MSYPDTTPPSRRAVAMAWSPETPAPITRTVAEEGQIVPPRPVVGAVAEHLEERVGGFEDFVARGRDPCSLAGVKRVGKSGGVSGALLDQHLAAGLDEVGDDGGNERHPPLS